MSRSIFCVLCGVCVAAAGALPAADNLIFNGGFELDTAGYELGGYQRPDRNPTLAFEPLVVDTTTFHSGTRSLRVPNRHGELGELFTRGVTLKQGTRYSVSVWMKSEMAYWLRLMSMSLVPRPLALTMPAVTVWSRPSGLPMARTHSPTCT